MRRISLRWLVILAVIGLTLLPAALVVWLVVPVSIDNVESAAENQLSLEADRVLLAADAHLRLSHEVLNGLLAGGAPGSATEQVRIWQQTPLVFETMAMALIRQSKDISAVWFAGWRGDFVGLQSQGGNARLIMSNAESDSRADFLAVRPGDRSQPLATGARGPDPRTQPWYTRAVEARSRIFSGLRPGEHAQGLYLSLSQPVHDGQGVTTAVVGVDLDLAGLVDEVRGSRIGARGISYVVDEQGVLVASSVDDALIRDELQGPSRRSPRDSGDAVVRASFLALSNLWEGQRPLQATRDGRLYVAPSAIGPVWMVQRPYGEALGLRWTLVVAAPADDFVGAIRNARDAALAFLFGFALLAGAVAWLLSQRLVARLGRLSALARDFGTASAVPVIPASPLLELDRLGSDLVDGAWQARRTLDQLLTDVAALQEANESLLQCLDQRTLELSQKRVEAASATRAKASFLSILSHEIRTPLNGVVGMSTLLAETPLDTEQRDYVQTLRLSSEQLLHVIHDILDYSQLESGQLVLEPAATHLRTVIEEACDIVAPQAREKGLDLLVDIPDAGVDDFPALVMIDAPRLRQVLIHLLQNAVKFTARGEVAVHVSRLPQPLPDGPVVLEFRVIDSGIGIAPERVESLFEAFTQVDFSPTRQYGGSGLGLAICRGLVGLMGGRIGVESELDQGSSFWFTVQVQVPVADALPFESPAPDAGRLLAGRVLIVHDAASPVRFLRRQLAGWAMEVALAEGGSQALEWIEAAQERRRLPAALASMSRDAGTRLPWMPEIILMDMHLSEMDAVMLARTIRSRPEWAGISLILLSSGMMPANSANARLFDALLLKPVRQAQLCETLLRCLAPGRWQAVRTADTQSAPAGARKTVLVVDDLAVNRKVAAAMLARLGFDVEQAAGGREAVAAVARSMANGPLFAAILMDLNMPQIDGLLATRQIIEAWGAAAPPVIALTAAALPQDEQRCLDAGMVAYLTKPLQVAALARVLEKWAGSHDRQRLADAIDREPALALDGQDGGDEPDKLMDFSRLEEFREFDDDERTMIREVVAMFIAEAPQRLAVIEAAVASGDAAALSVAAHALKGAAGNVGASALQSLCRRIEEDSRETVSEAAPAQVARLHLLWAQTREALASWK